MDLEELAFWSVGGVRGRILVLLVFFIFYFLLECMYDARACNLSFFIVERFI
jgi:hypothetical protein